MKNKSNPPGRKRKNETAQSVESKIAPPVETMVATEIQYPPPEYLAELAAKMPNVRLVEDYTEAIKTLRDDKRLTFREIAEWLGEHGVETDHNGVYRAYTKGMAADDVRAAEIEDAIDEGNL